MARTWRAVSPEAARAHPLYGVHGWLFVLVAILAVFGPLVAVSRVHAGFTVAERHLAHLAPVVQWADAKLATWCAVGLFESLSAAGGVALMLGKSWQAVRVAQGALWVSGPVANLAIQVLIPWWASGNLDFADAYFMSGFAGPMLVSIVAAALWTAYLGRSQRIRVTYGHAVAEAGA